MSALFKVSRILFWFPEGSIPEGSLLSVFLTTSNLVKRDGDAILLEDVNLPAMRVVHRYLVYNQVPEPDQLHILEAFAIPLDDSYELASAHEEHMRANMYLEEYEYDEINTDPHYGLVRLTSDLWSRLKVERPDDPNLLFTQTQLQKRSWGEIQESLSELKPLFGLGSVLVAGGRVFSALFGTKSSDVDLFVHGVGPKEAEEVIYALGDHLSPPPPLPEPVPQVPVILRIRSNPTDSVELSFTRTNNAVSFVQENERIAFHPYKYIREKKEYQVILRLYRTPSEVLHGFDVDCCSIGYDGENIWIARRALFALTHGYNTVNFGRLSPSYEYRLIKYGTRGVSVKIPHFDRDKVKQPELQARYLRWKEGLTYKHNGTVRYKEIKNERFLSESCLNEPQLKGLDTLLYLEHHCKEYKWHKRVVATVERLADESSDYSPQPYKNYKSDGQQIESLIDAIMVSSSLYPEKAAKYIPLLRDLVREGYTLEEAGIPGYEQRGLTDAESKALVLNTNTLMADEFAFIQCQGGYRLLGREYLEVLLHIPDSIYEGLGYVHPWKLPKDVAFKVINPGEQTTGTFHKLVLDDPKVWYWGYYYTL